MQPDGQTHGLVTKAWSYFKIRMVGIIPTILGQGVQSTNQSFRKKFAKKWYTLIPLS